MTENSKFKYQSVMDYIQQLIDNNAYGKDTKLPTEEQIAKELGLSRATIQRALKRLKDEGVIYRIQGSGTFASPPRATAKSNIMIPLILPNQFNEMHGFDIIRGAQTYLNSHSCHLSPYCLNSAGEKEYQDTINQLVDSGARCIMIMVPDMKYNKNLFFNLSRTNVHFVFLDTLPGYMQHVNFISSDHEMGGFLAAEHLIGLGHQKIALVSPHSVNVSYLANLSLRIRGFIFALQQNNLPIRRDYFCFCAGEDQVAEAAKKLIALPDPPTAIFALNDIAANVAIQSIEAEGLKIPDDLSVIGFDDLSLRNPITTVRQDFYAIGYYSAQTALELLSEENHPIQNLFLPVNVVPRYSTAPLIKNR